MPAYPSLPINADSEIVPDAGLLTQRATNGALKVRRMFSADKSSFTVKHYLTEAQRASLQSFYTTNRLADIQITWPGDSVTYNTRFAAAPRYVWLGGFFEAQVDLREV